MASPRTQARRSIRHIASKDRGAPLDRLGPSANMSAYVQQDNICHSSCEDDVWQSLEPLPSISSQSLWPPGSLQILDVREDAVPTRGEAFASHSPFPYIANHAAIADIVGRDTRSLIRTRRYAARLELLDLDEWNENKTHDEDLPTCLHYSIEWKVTLNNKLISKDTQPNLVLT